MTLQFHFVLKGTFLNCLDINVNLLSLSQSKETYVNVSLSGFSN